MEESILVVEGLNQINITNANLNALESKITSYLNKPKDTINRTTKNSYIDLMIPNIKFNFESAMSNHTKSPLKPESNLKITDLTKNHNNNNISSIADSEVIIKSFSNQKLKTNNIKTEREEEDEK